MTDQERDEPLTNVERAEAEVGRSGSAPEPPPEDTKTPADQAVSNQEQALESGEENVV
jgi:hypothetical protein